MKGKKWAILWNKTKITLKRKKEPVVHQRNTL